MDRRNLLKSLFAGVASIVTGKLFAGQAKAAPVEPTYIDRTTNAAVKIIKCKTLEVVNHSGGMDGYRTLTTIDGASPYVDADGYTYLERTITVCSEAAEEPVITVDYLRRKYSDWAADKYDPAQDSFVTATIDADHVRVECGAVKIETHPKRCPFQITIGGLEPHVRSVHVRFAEGELPWVNLVIKPVPLEPVDDEPLPVFQGNCFAKTVEVTPSESWAVKPEVYGDAAD